MTSGCPVRVTTDNGEDAGSNPVRKDDIQKDLFRWACGKRKEPLVPLALPDAMVYLNHPDTTPAQAVGEIERKKLPWECVPTEMLRQPDVWQALLPNLGLTAVLRNLGRMTSIGLLTDRSDSAQAVMARFTKDALIKARVHPIQILTAMLTYGQGHGVRGSLSWKPNQKVLDAMDVAFYDSMTNVQPFGSALLVALDISGSMAHNNFAGGTPGLTPMIAGAALASIYAHIEPQVEFIGFGTQLHELRISKRRRLDDIVRELSPQGGTDCSLPFRYLHQAKDNFKGAVLITDSETWAGSVHPVQVLEDYRRKRGVQLWAVCMGMVATQASILDNSDPNTLEVVGFDTSAPQMVSSFLRGEF